MSYIKELINKVQSGRYNVKELDSLYKNAKNNPKRKISDLEEEMLIKAIELAMRKLSTREANKHFGKVDDEVTNKLEEIWTDLCKEFSFDNNKVGNGVKNGGDTISKGYCIQKYVSYKNQDGCHIELCFEQQALDDLMVRVIKKKTRDDTVPREEQVFSFDDEARYLAAFKRNLEDWCGLVAKKD